MQHLPAVVAPTTPLLEQSYALCYRVRQHNGGNPYVGRHHRSLLLEAGFARAEAAASAASHGSPAECRQHAAFLKARLRGAGRTALAVGWVDQATLAAMAEEIDAWAERPGAFSAVIGCEAIGRVGVGG